jgi:hypothetical protein
MAFDRIPISLLATGNEADIVTWDSAGEPTTLSLSLGDFIYRDPSGAMAAIGNGANAGQVLVSDGAGGWLIADQTGSGGGASGSDFVLSRQVYAIASPVVDPATEFEPGISTSIQLPTTPDFAEEVVILFDGTVQGTGSFASLIVDILTFTDPIPAEVSVVEAITFTQLPLLASAVVFDPLNLPTTIVTGLELQTAIEELDAYLANITAAQVAFDDTLLGSGATDVQGALDAIATTPGVIPTPFVDSFYLIRDEKPAGTDGGTAQEAGWYRRDLNAEDINGITGASLNANQITLEDGTYYVEWQTMFNADADGALGDVRTRIYNIVDGTTEVASMNLTVDGGATIQPSQTSMGTGFFTVAGGPKIFELQYNVQYEAPDRGLGKATNSGIPEIYTILKIWQV